MKNLLKFYRISSLLDHLLLELADDGVDAHPLLVRGLQPPQPLQVLRQTALLKLLQLTLQLRQLVLQDDEEYLSMNGTL